MFETDQQVDAFIKKWLGEAFEDFIKGFMVACGHEPLAGSIPIEVTLYFVNFILVNKNDNLVSYNFFTTV